MTERAHATDLPADHSFADTQVGGVGGHLLHPDQCATGAHPVVVGVDPSQPDPTKVVSTSIHAASGPADPSTDPTMTLSAPSSGPSGRSPSSRPPIELLTPTGVSAGGTSYPVLALYADALDDMETTRIANENRARSLEQMGAAPADVAHLTAIIDALAAIERQTELQLNRAVRKHPLGPWVKATKGIGEKQGARLIAAIGDPYWNTLHDRPRTVSELWAYCGYHVLHSGHTVLGSQTSTAGVDPSSNPGHKGGDAQNAPAGVAPIRTKGQRSNWSNTAKTRAYLCAEAAIKAGVRKLDGADDTDGYDVAHREAISPLGQVYLDGRAKYAGSLHGADCRRCGPKGNPAPAGSPLSEGHRHARALRLVAKEILRQLWLEARALHIGEVA